MARSRPWCSAIASKLIGSSAEQPTAVAATGAESDELGLDDHDAQVRVDLAQVVRRPQPGVAGADDGHVGGDIARQLRARGHVVIGWQRVEPEGHSAGVGHRPDTTQCISDGPTLTPMLPTPTGWFPDPWNEPAFGTGTAGRGPGMRRYPCSPPQPHPSLPIRVLLGVPSSRCWSSLTASKYLLKVIAGYEWPIAVYVTILGVVGYAPALLWCWYASRRWGTGHFRADVGLKAKWVDAGWGPVTWGACLVTQIVVGIIVVVLKVPFTSNVRDVSEFDTDRGYVVSLLVLAVVAAPICEEIVFRGVVLRGLLSRNGAVVAVGLQGVLFGLAHFDPIRGSGNIGLILVLSSVGCVLGGAAYFVRRLAPSMIAHAIINGIAMALALSGWLDNP